MLPIILPEANPTITPEPFYRERLRLFSIGHFSPDFRMRSVPDVRQRLVMNTPEMRLNELQVRNPGRDPRRAVNAADSQIRHYSARRAFSPIF